MAKQYTPVFHYPSEKTGLFEGETIKGKILKDIKDSNHEEYGGWWPSFFPTAMSFLVTGDKDKHNVMSVSCVVVVNAYPFMLGMPIFAGGQSPRGDGPRYSLELLEESHEYTLNLPFIDNEMTKKIIICGSISGRDGVDKFVKAGLSIIPSRHVGPPIIKECPMNIECRVHSMTLLGTHCWVIGKALAVYLDESVAKGRDHLEWRSLPVLKKGA